MSRHDAYPQSGSRRDVSFIPATPTDVGSTPLVGVDINRAVSRIAHEIHERHGSGDVVLLGIPTRGVPLAQRVAAKLKSLTEQQISVASLSVTPFRDDRDPRDRGQAPHIEPALDVTDTVAILVDDVIHTGRTARAALDALTAVGRPRIIRLAVLIDRGHRELPIRADFVGKNIPTAPQQHVDVALLETDGRDEVTISEVAA